MKDALQRVADNPEAQRHRRPLAAAHDEDGNRDDHEGEVPHEVQNHYRLRVGPIALALLDLLGRSFADADGGLAHRAAAAAGAAEEAGGAAEARRSAEEAGAIAGALLAEQRRGVDGGRGIRRAVVVRRHRLGRRRISTFWFFLYFGCLSDD